MFNVGDKVVVRMREAICEDLNLRDVHSIQYGPAFIITMKEFCGKVYKICNAWHADDQEGEEGNRYQLHNVNFYKFTDRFLLKDEEANVHVWINGEDVRISMKDLDLYCRYYEKRGYSYTKIANNILLEKDGEETMRVEFL